MESPLQRVGNLKGIYERCTFALSVFDTITFEEAKKSKKWKRAIVEEIGSIYKNVTWELSELPSEKKIVGVKWIYKTKYKPNGEVDKYKAKLVAKGYIQEYGNNYEEVFIPVA